MLGFHVDFLQEKLALNTMGTTQRVAGQTSDGVAIFNRN
jgi:hypothetical protein